MVTPSASPRGDPPATPSSAGALDDAGADEVWGDYLRLQKRLSVALECYGEVTSPRSAVPPSSPGWAKADAAARTIVDTDRVARGVGYVPEHAAEVADASADDPTLDPLERRARRFAPACRALPKVELHAHLNGCVRDSTLMELAVRRAGEAGAPGADPSSAGPTAAELREMLRKPDGTGPRPLARCFDLFGAIHHLCTDHDTLRRIAAEAVMDFARDGVVYLELRTTPKDLPARGVTKESYCEAVLLGVALGARLAARGDGAKDSHATPAEAKNANRHGHGLDRGAGSSSDADPAIVARLILSVDRRESAEEAKRTVQLAAYLRDVGLGVVGVDLSGNPTVGTWRKFEPAMRLARSNGLPVTLHCGEVTTRGEEAAMLAFAPERLGHCVKTVRDDATWRALRESKIPVEICVTSNVITDSIEGGNGAADDASADGGPSVGSSGSSSVSAARAAARHHVALLHAANHPFCISTDDPGVFATTLSREYALAAVAAGLRSDDLRRVASRAFEYAFIHAAAAGDAESADADAAAVAAVRRRLREGCDAWEGLPALNVVDAVAESASKARSATAKRLRIVAEPVVEAAARSLLFRDDDDEEEEEEEDDDDGDENRRGDGNRGHRRGGEDDENENDDDENDAGRSGRDADATMGSPRSPGGSRFPPRRASPTRSSSPFAPPSSSFGFGSPPRFPDPANRDVAGELLALIRAAFAPGRGTLDAAAFRRFAAATAPGRGRLDRDAIRAAKIFALTRAPAIALVLCVARGGDWPVPRQTREEVSALVAAHVAAAAAAWRSARGAWSRVGSVIARAAPTSEAAARLVAAHARVAMRTARDARVLVLGAARGAAAGDGGGTATTRTGSGSGTGTRGGGGGDVRGGDGSDASRGVAAREAEHLRWDRPVPIVEYHARDETGNA